MRKAIITLLLLSIGMCLLSCGASQISDKDIRQSQRFYDAAYIAWQDQHDVLAAIRHLTRAVEKDPANDNAHYLLGTIRLSRGEYIKAESHLLSSLKIRNEDRPTARVEVQNSLGVLYIHLEKYDKAVKHLSAASGEVLNREPWLALGNLGWAYIKLGQYNEAITTLKRALFDQPLFCVGLYRLGEAYYLQGEYDFAKINLTKAVSIEEGGCNRMQESHHLLAMTYLRLHDIESAKKYFEICNQINPDSKVGLDCAKTRLGL